MASMSARHIPVLLGLSAALAACNYRSPGQVSGVGKGDSDGGIQDPLADTREVSTFASPLELVAGGQIEVRCVVQKNGEYLTGEAVAVQASPSLTPSSTNADHVYLNPTASGTYSIKC